MITERGVSGAGDRRKIGSAAAIAAEKSVFSTVWLGFREEEGEGEKGRETKERRRGFPL